MSGKFKPLFNKEGKEKTVAQLPGRHPCECQASKHDLINNCVSCGRIVCSQEGSGPCFHCSELVCTKSEEEILRRDSKKSMKLRQNLMGKTVENSKEKAAIEHKNKLLEFDETCAKRTRVIDDESDYFSTGVGTWLTKKERDAVIKQETTLRDKRFASRRDRKIQLDFCGRQENDLPESMYDEVIHQESKEIAPKALTYGRQRAPKFLKENSSEIVGSVCKEHEISKSRIQYDEQLETMDNGMCLSMHQPWASLLIKGIKKTEGRTWYSSHRGRLWIASTSKQPTRENIDSLESYYRETSGESEFPSSYPTSSLLGCVDVIDVIQPNTEGSSPYEFVCINPQELPLKFTMKGQHKISVIEQS
ncbi:DgyrCDS12081 [Dimorphilus gyrociliatus]|uniref:DgyrCDS12081 n=1 Tax=Dimorphilus gyrociliatus TaxID=2664684 RepID=A0A7I8W8G8_9ANNE|nr:DgyrCDS12081 [Dimorphilus gyrociliatus]